MQQKTNFTLSELSTIWARLDLYVLENWNTGKGKRTAQTPKYCFFMLLVVIKHGGRWDFLGRMFDIKAPTIERLIVRILDAILPTVQELHVHRIAEYFTMSKLLQRKTTFRTYKLARYATDVTF